MWCLFFFTSFHNSFNTHAVSFLSSWDLNVSHFLPHFSQVRKRYPKIPLRLCTPQAEFLLLPKESWQEWLSSPFALAYHRHQQNPWLAILTVRCWDYRITKPSSLMSLSSQRRQGQQSVQQHFISRKKVYQNGSKYISDHLHGLWNITEKTVSFVILQILWGQDICIKMKWIVQSLLI